MNNCYFVFGSCFDYCNYMVHDALNKNNVFFYNQIDPIGNPILYFFYKIHRRLKLPFRSFYFKFFFDYKTAKRSKGSNVFVFFDSNPLTCDQIFLKYIKTKIRNSVTVIYFANSLSMRSFNSIQYFKSNFDQIYSYDSDDCLKNGFSYIEGLYSPPPLNKSIKEINDVLFVGDAKGRELTLIKVYNSLVKKGFRLDFTITNSKCPLPDGIKQNRLKYEEILKKIAESKCILEIKNERCCGATLRYCEAVVYGKFLISDNVAYLESKYYKSGNIKIINFNDFEGSDFNTDFFANKRDYEYDGDFSFSSFLMMIDTNISNNKSS